MTAPATPDLREAAIAAALETFQKRDGYHKAVIVDLLEDFGAFLYDALLGPDGPLASVMREREAIKKINNIRNSIIGLQTMNWSEHIYPLVAALEEAGIQGMDYPEARENFGTMLERTNAAESETAALKAAASRDGEAARQDIERLRAVLEGLLPSKLCGESWGCPDAERVSIVVSFGALRAARAALTTTEARDRGQP